MTVRAVLPDLNALDAGALRALILSQHEEIRHQHEQLASKDEQLVRQDEQ